MWVCVCIFARARARACVCVYEWVLCKYLYVICFRIVSFMYIYFLMYFNFINYVFLILCFYITNITYALFCIYSVFIMPTATLGLPPLRFTSVVKKMPWYNSQIRCTARTIPN